MGFFTKLFGKKQEPTQLTPEIGKSHTKVCKVAGVTFDDRQKYMKKLKADKKSGKAINVKMEEYNFKGEPAIRILANGYDVGNLHREDVAFVKSNQERILGINDFTIGEHYDENEKISYNAKVKLIIANKS